MSAVKCVSKVSKAEQANERTAGKQADKRVAQYMRGDSGLFWTLVLGP